MERRSAPIITLSLALSKSIIVTKRRPIRAAVSAASLTRLARSGPQQPGVAGVRRATQAPPHPRPRQRRLVDEVGEVRARETRRAPRDDPQVHVRPQRHL